MTPVAQLRSSAESLCSKEDAYLARATSEARKELPSYRGGDEGARTFLARP